MNDPIKYAKIENGQCYTNMPMNDTLPDGSTVCGLPFLSKEELKELGWLPLIERYPTYQARTQYLQFSGYEREGDTIVANYVAVDIIIPEPTPPQPNYEDYIIELDYRLSIIELDL